MKKVFLTAATVLVPLSLASLLSGCDNAADIEKLRSEAPHHARSLLSTFEQETSDRPTGEGPQTATVFEGRTARALLVDKVTGPDAGFFGDKRMRTEILAQTPSGRYFSLEYTVYAMNVADCLKDVHQCDESLTSFRELSPAAARSWVFYGHFSDADYKKLFGEEPPAHTKPA